MGKHKDWRKTAKKQRRKRLRVHHAKLRDSIIENNTEEYEKLMIEQEALEKFEYEQIEISNIEANQKWLEAEKLALEHWNILQNRKRLLLEEYLEQQAKLELEWEREKQLKKEKEQKLKEMEEERKRTQEVFMSQLEQFMSGDSIEPPAELLITHETRPHLDLCPFFSKTGCCRFGDQCSRNHRYPGISNVLLAGNFFIHFGLENSNYSEYDTDVMLEYEDSDTHKEFVDFFNDVLPEFEKYGRITQFKVCNNYEKHLRGNTYIEFAELRSAVAAYRSLHSRWYGGRQLSLQFCRIDSWKNSICGLASRNRCPKGRACNFLHVFRNPNKLFLDYKLEPKRHYFTPTRSWRWSESPEREIKPRRQRSRSRERERREKTTKPKERKSYLRNNYRSNSPVKRKNKR